MIINFVVNQVFNGWEPTDTRLGGTEESVVRWAEELAARGHQVTVYRNGTSEAGEDSGYTHSDGVIYKPREFYTMTRAVGDICINIKSSEIAPKEPTLYLTNETNASDLDLSKYLGVIWPSEWAADNIPVNNPLKFILPHGYDSDNIYPGLKIPKQCLYASSPDRGLDVLLDAWPYVYANNPDATLIVTYGAEPREMPGVMFLGETDEETMNELYRTSDVWCHPCTGGELYGMTGIKAQAAGCVPVIIPTMALQETVKAGVIADKRNYADLLNETLKNNELRETIRQELQKIHYPDWVDSTDRLLEIINLVV